MKLHAIFCVLLLFTTLTLTSSPDSIAIKDLTTALELIKEGKKAEAEPYICEGMLVLQQGDDLENWLNWHRLLGRAWRKSNPPRPYDALEVFQEGLDGMWRRPIKDKEFERLARIQMERGYTFSDNLGDYLSTRDCYLHASKIFLDTLNREDFWVAKYVLTYLGNTYTRLNDFENAQFYLEKVKKISWEAKEWDKWAEICSDIGLMYNRKKDYKKALECFEEGLESKDSLSFRVGNSLLVNTGLVLNHLEDFKNALKYTDLAQEEIESVKDTWLINDIQYSLFINYGKIYNGLGLSKTSKIKEQKNTLRYFIMAEENYLKGRQILSSDDHITQAFLCIYLGDLYLDWQKPLQALREYQMALTWLIPTFKPSDNLENPVRESLQTEYLLGTALERKGKSLLVNFHNSNNYNFLLLAIQCYELADDITKALLQTYIMEGSQLVTLNEQHSVKESALETAFCLWQNQSSEEWGNKLLSFSEQSRALLLLKNHQISAVLDEANQTFHDQYFHLKHQISTLETTIAQTNENPDKQLALPKRSQEQLLLHQKLEALVNTELNAKQINIQSDYYEQITINEIQGSLDSNQVLIEYFVGEYQLFIFQITKEGFYPIKKTLPPDFNQNVDRLRQTLTDNPIVNQLNYQSDFIRSASKLYDLLLKDLLDKLPDTKNRLIIIPDGVLGLIPFDLLLTSPSDSQASYGTLPYLLQDFNISYSPSIKLYLRQKATAPARAKQGFVGFAPTYDCGTIFSSDTIYQMPVQQDTSLKKAIAGIMERSGDCALPGAKREVTAIKKILGGKIFLDHQASERHFKDNAHRYQILLLAMHSLVNEKDYDHTKLLFTEEASGEEEDDILHAFELRSLNLQADMAVLSACNTGYGQLEVSEGVMSLSRSFFACGIPSTVMSLWSVPDVATSDIMKYFFNNLKKGLHKDEALRLAKIQYLSQVKTPQEAHPYFWAGFITAGNMEALVLERPGLLRWWHIGMGLLLAGLLYLGSGSHFTIWRN